MTLTVRTVIMKRKKINAENEVNLKLKSYSKPYH